MYLLKKLLMPPLWNWYILLRIMVNKWFCFSSFTHSPVFAKLNFILTLFFLYLSQSDLMLQQWWCCLRHTRIIHVKNSHFFFHFHFYLSALCHVLLLNFCVIWLFSLKCRWCVSLYMKFTRVIDEKIVANLCLEFSSSYRIFFCFGYDQAVKFNCLHLSTL